MHKMISKDQSNMLQINISIINCFFKFFLSLLKGNVEHYILIKIHIGLKKMKHQNVDRFACKLVFHIPWRSLKVYSLTVVTFVDFEFLPIHSNSRITAKFTFVNPRVEVFRN